MPTDNHSVHAEFIADGHQIVEEVLSLLHFVCQTPEEKAATLPVFKAVLEQLHSHGLPSVTE